MDKVDSLQIQVSAGDFCDRHSILDIKRSNGLKVDQELQQYETGKPQDINYMHYFEILKAINSQLWDLEDKKRKYVSRYSTDESDTAYMITQLNDLRHETKKRLDAYFNCDITEKKSH